MENRSNLAFEKCSAIKELNKVEGFNPMDYVTVSQNERGEEYINLETKYRLLWFRLLYPNGKITKKILRLSDQSAAVEARVYLDRSDAENDYIASGIAQRFFDPNKDFGAYYLETAETIAEGRALGKAGFGIQFCDVDGQKDDVMPDAGIKAQNSRGTAAGNQSPQPETRADKTANRIQPAETKKDAPGNTNENNAGNTSPDSKGSAEKTDTPAKHGAAGKAQADSSKDESGEQKKQMTLLESAKKTADTQNSNAEVYDESTPVDEILKIMTVAEAESVVVGIGFNRGKTLRQISLANHRQLRWFFESYSGDNNILKAGAKLLYERSQQQPKAS